MFLDKDKAGMKKGLQAAITWQKEVKKTQMKENMAVPRPLSVLAAEGYSTAELKHIEKNSKSEFNMETGTLHFYVSQKKVGDRAEETRASTEERRVQRNRRKRKSKVLVFEFTELLVIDITLRVGWQRQRRQEGKEKV